MKAFWNKLMAQKPFLPVAGQSLTAWDDLKAQVEPMPIPAGDELMAFREKILPRVPVKPRQPRVEILKKGETVGSSQLSVGSGVPVMALTGAEMRPWGVEEAVPRATQQMRDQVAVRKVEREVAGLPEETVGRMLGLERLKVRELEGRLIEMESRARLAEARVGELDGAVEFGHQLLRESEQRVASLRSEVKMEQSRVEWWRDLWVAEWAEGRGKPQQWTGYRHDGD